MNLLDVLIAVMAVSAVVGGYRLGFAQRIVAWLGLAVGLGVALRLLPTLAGGDEVATSARFLRATAVLLGGGIVGQLLGSVVGGRLRRLVHVGGLGPADSIAGAALGLLGLVLMCWVVLPVMADVRGWPARQARGSTVADTIDRVLGDPPPLLDGFEAALGRNGFPEVFARFRTSPEVEVPATSPVDDAVVRRVAASTVKLQGPACDRVLSGSGFVVADDLVVTNAHVLAGAESVTVATVEGDRRSGVVLAFDPATDLALVRVRGLGRPALPLGDAAAGEVGVVLGYPGGGDLEVQPFAVAERTDARGRDIYDQRDALRRILIMGAAIRAGDSGGPMVDAAGEVVGVTFAVAPDRDDVAYAIRTEEVRRLLASAGAEPVGTGPCL